MFGVDETIREEIRKRLRLVMFVVISIFCVLVLRLGYLQIICNDYYKKRAEGNRFRSIRFVPPRGIMYDRTGQIIVENKVSFDVSVTPSDELQSWIPDAKAQKALQLLGLTKEDIIEKLKRSKDFGLEPVVIKEDVDGSTIAYIAENSTHMPYFVINTRLSRRYDSVAPHVIGYTGPVTEQDVKNGYAMTDIAGKAGLEAYYEDLLKGDLGWRLVEVNTFGHIVRKLPLPDNTSPGKNLYLTLDLQLQRKAEELLEGKVGAIVALDPRNGGVLAMASSPSYDAQIFIDSNRKAERCALINAPNNPLLNRAIMGKYPPGSTFKIITATAALEEGLIDESTRFFCGGGLYVGNHYFRCHKLGGHGSVSVREALPLSCNVFFYNVAYRSGLDVPTIYKYAKMYSLGQKTGIDLPYESPGFIPSESRYFSDKVNMAIGQGSVLVTPLQMANVISVIANRGFSYRPHVVDQSKVFHGSKPEILVDLRDKVSVETINVIRDSLRNVARHGLQKSANLKSLQVGGKTGTAQNPHGEEHAWYIGFAPFDDPEIVIAVLVENVGRGSEFAAPIAGQLLAYHFYGYEEQEHQLELTANSNNNESLTND